MKKGCFFISIFLLPLSLVAQEMWGISNSNFAGNMGMGLNPATMVAAPYSMEINILSGDLFLQNNYIYVRKKSSFFAKTLKGESLPEGRITDFYTRPAKSGYLQVKLLGPSIIVNKGNLAFGFHSGIRMGFSAKSLPVHFTKFMYDGFDFGPQHGINFKSGPFSATLLAWSEAGLSFGMTLKETKSNLLTGAITLNYLQGLNAMSIEIDKLDYIVPNSQLLVVNNIQGSYAHTGLDNNGNIAGQVLSVKGNGFSGDLGFNYFHKKLERAYVCGNRSNAFKKYNYKIGFSVIDLGFVQLKKNASVFSFDNASAQWPGIDTVKFDNLADFDSSLSNQFFNDPQKSMTGSSFSIFLPAAGSIQFDYCIKPRWYINATWIQRIPIGEKRILRPNQISITPRYETRSFEIAIPFSLYDYSQPRFGLALRYKFFVLGTDKIGAFTGIWDISGIDLYFGFKVKFCTYKKRRKGGNDCDAF